MTPIILASGSKNRLTILQTLSIPFKVVVSDLKEEAVRETNPGSRAKKLAQLKGNSVSKKYPNAIIIGADTLTGCQGKILEKPNTVDEARTILWFLSGKQAINYTGFYYFDPAKKIKVSKIALTKLKFRRFYPEEVDRYLERFPVCSWAGSYAASELYVMGMIETVSGSLTGLTHGLPLEHLVPLLVKSGFKPSP